MNGLFDHFSRRLGPLTASVARLCGQAHPIDLAKRQPLLRAGERWQHLWWLERGALRLYYIDRDGQAANKNFYLDGALLWPITPALRDVAVHFWVEALEPSRVWALPWAAWAAQTRGFDPWQTLERGVLASLLDEKMAREHAFLQLSATQRYQAMQTEHPEWLARIPLVHLASWLGVTDVALSRIRRRLNPG